MVKGTFVGTWIGASVDKDGIVTDPGVFVPAGQPSPHQDWQPIETIPKGSPDKQTGQRNGPLVLVWLPADDMPWVARWTQYDDSPGTISSTYREYIGHWCVDLCSHPDPTYHPTHWTPLPCPPPKE